jgi:hypothetical protein
VVVLDGSIESANGGRVARDQAVATEVTSKGETFFCDTISLDEFLVCIKPFARSAL